MSGIRLALEWRVALVGDKKRKPISCSFLLITAVVLAVALSSCLIYVWIQISSRHRNVEYQSQHLTSNHIVIPTYRFDVDFSSAEGFDAVILQDPPAMFPKLVIRQGRVGKIQLTLSRQYTNSTLWILLCLYGVSPNFDEWRSISENTSLPKGVTYAINPSLQELSTGENCFSTLTIAVSPDTNIGSYKLMVDAILIYSSGEEQTSSTGISFTLEVIPSG